MCSLQDVWTQVARGQQTLSACALIRFGSVAPIGVRATVEFRGYGPITGMSRMIVVIDRSVTVSVAKHEVFRDDRQCLLASCSETPYILTGHNPDALPK